MNQPTAAISLLIALIGCDAGDKTGDTGGEFAPGETESLGDDGGDDGGGETGESSTTPDDTGGASVEDPQFSATDGPCNDGGWGTITDPTNTVHFWGGLASNAPDESAEAIGEMNAPFHTWSDLQAVRSADPNFTLTAVGLWAGEHTLPAELLLEFATNEIPVLGCGSDEVTTTVEASGSDPSAPLLHIESGMVATLSGLSLEATDQAVMSITESGSAVLTDMQLTGNLFHPIVQTEGESQLSISNSTMTGGTAGIWTTGGGASITIDNVDILDTRGVGIWTTGGAASITNVNINNVTTLPGVVEGERGWGIVARSENIVIEDVNVNGAVRAGIIASVGTIASIKNVTVQNITPDAGGQWGRGVYIEGMDGGGSVNMEDVLIENVYETGLFIQDLDSATLANITIAGVYEPESIYGESTYGEEAKSGDGFVVVQNADPDTIDPHDVAVQLLGVNSFTGIARAGIISHGAHLQLTIPMEMDAGSVRDDTSIFVQGYGYIEVMETLDSGLEPAPSLGLVSECGSDDSYALDCETFDFDSDE